MEKCIEIKGARVHNLKSLDVKIPHGKMTVVTGLSGSGKSSLAFDTLYAEGQRRFIESLSAYVRQFLGKLDKPETDYIKGIAPAIAIEQKVITSNPRSTVGTTTEIYDYMKILFARVGKTIDPVSGEIVKKHNVQDVLTLLKAQKADEKAMILAPILGFEKYGLERQLKLLFDQGYARLFLNNETINIEDAMQAPPKEIAKAQLLIDRIVCRFEEEEEESRIADSIQLAYGEGGGDCSIYFPSSNEEHLFSNKFEHKGVVFQEPNEHFFTFNNPYGACRTCEGFGQVIGIDENLVIPDRSKSVYEGAIAAWKGDSMGEYLNQLVMSAKKFDFPIHRPIDDLTDAEYNLLWTGNEHFEGLDKFFKFLESQTYKIQYRVMLSRYRGKTDCKDCHGSRLRKDANYVKIDEKSITDVVLLPVEDALKFYQGLDLMNQDAQVAKRILPEIISRITFLCEVGLGYLTLNRAANSLSGGESQRINLATSLGSNLVGSMYILDEPSIGLHPRDTARLVKVLQDLRDLGNTVIVVEHEEDIMKAADEILDIGPGAGRFGGELVFQGDHKALLKAKNSLTADYLLGKEEIEVPTKRRPVKNVIEIIGARKNNLKNIDVQIPLNSLVCVTGVSGSGKSTLIRDILYPGVRGFLGIVTSNPNGAYKSISGDLKQIKTTEFIDQNPIGKSSRSNPATYVKAFDDIRDLFSKVPLARSRGYKPGFFSFNVDGGRCEMCEGEGEITVGMQFMADVHLPCDVCEGTRYKQETLEIELAGVNIAQLLAMDIEDAVAFFKTQTGKTEAKIVEKLQPLLNVGLGYLQLGQSSSTLSGGEAQRVKLASFLAKGANADTTLFIFDEPTTGLHFHDVKKLVIAFNALIDNGHSVVVIEHNMDVIKCADHLIDLGTEGGNKGGHLIFAGTPEELVKVKESYTAEYLKEKLK
jgi:excinuclease ABC subunit A